MTAGQDLTDVQFLLLLTVAVAADRTKVNDELRKMGLSRLDKRVRDDGLRSLREAGLLQRIGSSDRYVITEAGRRAGQSKYEELAKVVRYAAAVLPAA